MLRPRTEKQYLSIFKSLAGCFLISLFWCWHLKILLIDDWLLGKSKMSEFFLSFPYKFKYTISQIDVQCREDINQYARNKHLCTKKFVKW